MTQFNSSDKMQSILILLLTVLGAVLADQPVINTPPSVAQCLPSQVSFNGGVPPYYISVLPGGQTTAAALEDFPMQATSPYTWIVKQPAGTPVTLQIRDSNGQINYSQQVTVQSGQSNCLGNSDSSGSSNSSATTTTNTTSPASETPTTDNATATASNATSTTTPSTTNTSSPTTATKGSSPFTTTPSTSNSSSTVSGTSNPAAGAARNSAASSKFNAALIATVVVGTTFALSA